ncbi:histidine kinase [Streptosporangium sp. NPDC000239]|uniref:sensor histidine kinase n=1 Tax=Streptosporangium sp. NPDC000239 TaxID=3154248 RepID=UPI003329DA70
MGETHRIVYWIQRLSEIALIGWLTLLLLLDVMVVLTRPDNPVVWLGPVCGAIGVLAVLLRRTHRISGYATLLVASFVTTLIIGSSHVSGLPSFAETGSLLILTIAGLRWIEPISRAAMFSIASVVVLESAAGRLREDTPSLAVGFLVFVGWSIAAGVGAYLRFQLERRKEAVNSVRRAERLELARELHDLVAHHITGIVVQAQAAKIVAEHKPEAVVPALDAIAGAGADALTSMRRLVSVLRAQDGAARSPGSTLMDMRTLVERFSAGGPQVAFDIGQGINDETMAPEVLTTLHRVLQEALTNVRRHAPGTGWVEADLRLGGPPNGPSAGPPPGPPRREQHQGTHWVWLRVRNYGSATDAKISRLGGGFGLVGMSERVEALGGRLTAGHTYTGAWEVVAGFPVSLGGA